jgi:hypothetical protein
VADSPGTNTGSGVYVGSLEGGSPKLISGELNGNIAFASDRLIYGRDNSLRPRPFDPESFQLSGAETSLGEQELAVDNTFGHSQFSVSQDGILVFQSLADSASRLTWFDSAGKQLSQLADVGYKDPRLSPDGRLLAVASDDNHNGQLVIRVYDFARRVSSPISSGPVDMMPAWSPNGDRIIYAAYAQFFSLKEIAPDGSGLPRKILEKASVLNQPDWSPQGLLAFNDFSRGVPRAILYDTSKHDERVLSEPGVESRFSPDGRWVAFTGGHGMVVQSVLSTALALVFPMATVQSPYGHTTANRSSTLRLIGT